MYQQLHELTLPEKILLVKLYYQNGESATAALWSYRHRKGIPTGKCPMSISAMKRMISKFKPSGCFHDRPRSGRPSTSANSAQTPQEEVEIVTGSSTHGEVSAREVAHCAGIPFITLWIAVRRTLRCHPYKIQRHHELLSGNFVKRRVIDVCVFQKMAEDDNGLFNILWIKETPFTFRGSVKSHNCRNWAAKNFRTILETAFHAEKVTMRCWFTTSTVIGPFFLKKMNDSGFVTVRVTDERYADVLQNRVILILSDKHPLENTIFM